MVKGGRTWIGLIPAIAITALIRSHISPNIAKGFPRMKAQGGGGVYNLVRRSPVLSTLRKPYGIYANKKEEGFETDPIIEQDWDKLRFGGIERLYGSEYLSKFQNSHICIVGVGGVGSWTVESLARMGVGEMTMIDLDDICISNVNRQLHALSSTVGRQKVDVLAARAQDINPNIKIHAISDFFTNYTAEALFGPRRGGGKEFDVVIDAIDSVDHKADLIHECVLRSIPVITVGGAGGRMDPTQIKVSDLGCVTHDPLLKSVRKLLRSRYGYPPLNTDWGVPCVFSRERAYFPTERREGGEGSKMDCASGYGTATHVTGTFGFTAAHVTAQTLSRNSRPSAYPYCIQSFESFVKRGSSFSRRENKLRKIRGRARLGYYDAHCHLQLDGLYENINKIIENAKSNGVTRAAVCGCTPEDWERVAEISEKFPEFVAPQFGIHPWWSADVLKYPDWQRRLEEILIRFPHAGIGETGLDKVWGKYPNKTDLNDQFQILTQHIDICRRLERPLTLHCVKAYGRTLEALEKKPVRAAVMHSYGGSAEMAERLVKAGGYLSFSGGVARRPKWETRLVEIASRVPIERILVESDAPDQALPRERLIPGTQSQDTSSPADIPDLVEAMAHALGMPSEELGEITANNAKRVFDFSHH